MGVKELTNKLRAHSRQLRKDMTDAERALWRVLRQRQADGHKFRRQLPIGNYIVDFVCLESRLIVEIDGSQHSDRKSYDQVRDDWLRAEGFRVLRFWNNEVLENVEGVYASIESNLGPAKDISRN